MWAQIITTLVGIWLMAAPGILSFGGKAADNDHIIGPVIATFAITAMWECTNLVRKFNKPIGIWLIAAPIILGYDSYVLILNDGLAGFVVLFLSFIKMKKEKSYGGGWKVLWKS